LAGGIHRLSARTVATATKPGLYADGGGLYLQVTRGADGKPRRSWLLRFTAPRRRRREMGLGNARLVSLTDARDAALVARRQAHAGIDPIDARDAARAKAAAACAKAMTFRQCAEAYLATHASSWKNAKHSKQWQNTLETYAYPIIGDTPVAEVDGALVMAVLDPIWLTKIETASRVRGRIETVLDWARVRGHRNGDNPARWRGHLQKALPTIKKSLRVIHHPALPFADAPIFMRKLAEQEGVSARALAFCILTSTRTGETIHARWAEIDLEQRLWIIPAVRMKMAREHRVPLSAPAIAILRETRSRLDGAPDGAAFVFPSRRSGRALSNMALLATLKRMGRSDLTTHGFRSTFRDWVAERTDFPQEVAEASLAHIVGDAVEAAYRRGDFFDKRRRLMEAWGDYCVVARAAAPSA
jgi:integrase